MTKCDHMCDADLSTENAQKGISSLRIGGNDVVSCPICEESVLLAKVNQHIDMGCVGWIQSPVASATATAPAAATAERGKRGEKKGRPPPQVFHPTPAAGVRMPSSASSTKPYRKHPPAKPLPSPGESAAEAFPSIGESFPSLGPSAHAPKPTNPAPALQPIPPPALPLAMIPLQEERRIDPADGNAYTLAQFLEEYGDSREWDLARPVLPPALPTASPLVLPKPPLAQTVPPEEERRIDPADGNAYTLAEFLEEYGDPREWDLAGPVLPTVGWGSGPPKVGWGAIPAAATAAAMESAGLSFSQLTLEDMFRERLLTVLADLADGSLTNSHETRVRACAPHVCRSGAEPARTPYLERTHQRLSRKSSHEVAPRLPRARRLTPDFGLATDATRQTAASKVV